MENLFIQLQAYLKETSPLAYIVVFLGGILVSFRPCAYNLIPITVGYIGRLIVILVCLSLFLSSSAIALGQKNDEIDVGSLAPDFSLKDLKGEEIRLSNFKDKEIVILVFWATWCPYCLKEIPALKKIDEEYKDKGVKLLALNIREGKDKSSSFVDRYSIPYTILLDADGKIASLYRIAGIPTNIILDKQGIIRFKGHYIPKDYKKILDDLRE